MLDILLVVLFLWLFGKAVKLAFRVAWGTTKFLATTLFTLAGIALVLCLLFAGGVALLVPVGMVFASFALLKACIQA